MPLFGLLNVHASFSLVYFTKKENSIQKKSTEFKAKLTNVTLTLTLSACWESGFEN